MPVGGGGVTADRTCWNGDTGYVWMDESPGAGQATRALVTVYQTAQLTWVYNSEQTARAVSTEQITGPRFGARNGRGR